MARRFHKTDVEHLRRLLGVTQEEADALLRRTGGDVQKARKLYIHENGVFVEPLKIEDGPRFSVESLLESLMDIMKSIGSIRVRIVHGGDPLAALPLVVVMLAMLASPRLTFGSIAVMLFLNCRFTIVGQPKTNIVF